MCSGWCNNWVAPYIIAAGAPHKSVLEDFGGSHFPDKRDTDGCSNVLFLAIHPLDAVGSPRIFYWI
jgi:hypothetical protein